jgi:hypothetical protein
MPARRAWPTIWLSPEMPTASCSGAWLRLLLGQAAGAHKRRKPVSHFGRRWLLLVAPLPRAVVMAGHRGLQRLPGPLRWLRRRCMWSPMGDGGCGGRLGCLVCLGCPGGGGAWAGSAGGQRRARFVGPSGSWYSRYSLYQYNNNIHIPIYYNPSCYNTAQRALLVHVYTI